VDLGSLAGPVTIQNSNGTATNSLIVNGAAGNNTITAAGNQVTAGTQTISDTAPLASLTVNGGSGNNQLTVSALTLPVQSVTLVGGGGTNTYNVNAGTVNILAGTGVNVLNVTGGTVASITAPTGDTKPLVFAHSYTVLDNGTLSVPANGVLASDASANGQELTAILASGPAHGTLTFKADGSFTYKPAANFVGTDSFTYQARGSDGTLSAAAPVTIQVSYHFGGFLAPLNANIALALNRTVPIKFQLTDASGNTVTSLSAVVSLKILDSHGTDVLAGAGNTGLGVTGQQFHYDWQTKGLAPGKYTITLALADGTLDTLVVQLSANGSSAALRVDGAGSAAPVTGALLGGNIELNVDNANGELTADELARIQDAVTAVDAVTQPYGVTVEEVSDPSLADVTLSMDSTSAVGAYAEGVLGCTTDSGQISIINGWNFYAGSDATQIGAGQYDFQTVVTHELGHALGLGHSADNTSAMYATLNTGTVNRILTTDDLNVADTDATGACGLHAATFRLASDDTNAQGIANPIPADIHLTPASRLSATVSGNQPTVAATAYPAARDALFALLAPPSGNALFAAEHVSPPIGPNGGQNAVDKLTPWSSQSARPDYSAVGQLDGTLTSVDNQESTALDSFFAWIVDDLTTEQRRIAGLLRGAQSSPTNHRIAEAPGWMSLGASAIALPPPVTRGCWACRTQRQRNCQRFPCGTIVCRAIQSQLKWRMRGRAV
jgi:hypothetical protein